MLLIKLYFQGKNVKYHRSLLPFIIMKRPLHICLNKKSEKENTSSEFEALHHGSNCCNLGYFCMSLLSYIFCSNNKICGGSNYTEYKSMTLFDGKLQKRLWEFTRKYIILQHWNDETRKINKISFNYSSSRSATWLSASLKKHKLPKIRYPISQTHI